MGRRRRRERATPAVEHRAPWRFEPRWALVLFGFFLLSLAPRLYGGLTFGTDLDGPGTWSIVNYDEGGSCRALRGDGSYPRFIGRQIVSIATRLGHGPPQSAFGGGRGKAYCQTQALIQIQRVYSAVTGAMTVVVLGLIALMMWPSRPEIAWTCCALLGFSNLHVAYSHSGTVDAPQVFFIYLFTAVLVYASVAKNRWALLLSPLFLVGAVWTKWYVFAVFAYAGVVSQLDVRRRDRKYALAVAGTILLVVVALGWQDITEVISRRSGLFWGVETSKFGTGYGNIGTWRRWIRNAVNLPVVHIVGLGLPACLFVWNGFRHAVADRQNRLLWAVRAHAAAYAVYLLLLGPVTYYRHYLPLFPFVVLLAAYGLWHSPWCTRRLFLAFFFLYPALLTLDSEYNYRFDPRRELRPWYQNQGSPRIYFTYYVVPPRSARAALFNMEAYIRNGSTYLRPAKYVILSENWYDTSFPNELNGPIAWDPSGLIKTTPEYALAYRKILSGRDPNLQLAAEFDLVHFMPEFMIHRFFYGSFQLFIGDLKIYRVVRGDG